MAVGLWLLFAGGRWDKAKLVAWALADCQGGKEQQAGQHSVCWLK